MVTVVPISLLVMVTVAPGMTLPLASRIVPVIVPRGVLCRHRRGERERDNRRGREREGTSEG